MPEESKVKLRDGLLCPANDLSARVPSLVSRRSGLESGLSIGRLAAALRFMSDVLCIGLRPMSDVLCFGFSFRNYLSCR